ncbi:MAG: magnesium transporter [Acidimicrobiia bacterium]
MARRTARQRPLGPWGFLRRALGGPGQRTVRQPLISLALNSTTSLLAGGVLGSITGTLEHLPGLLVLVPAAIGLRGNVFSTLGSRLSTSIHAGTFRLSIRRDTLLGQNVLAAMALTASMSVLLAAVAKLTTIAFGLPGAISFVELALVSTVGGVLASVVVLGATMVLAAGSVRYGWDLDNVVAPVVSTLGDVLTLPALWLATHLVGIHLLTNATGALLIAGGLATLVISWRTDRAVLRQVVQESTPVLLVAAALSSLAGVVLEKRLDTLGSFPSLLVLVPAFVSSAGALGGILASRLATKLHLGMIAPERFPGKTARRDAWLLLLLGAPVYLFNAGGAHLIARLLGHASPGLLPMIEVSLLGGFFTTAFVVLVAFYSASLSFRVGVDPDTYGIPTVTSTVDFFGSVALIVTAVALGLA